MTSLTNTTPLNWPLMDNNITREDLDVVIEFLKGNPILTQNRQVRAFEEEWSRWLGVKHSVFLNSGSSANQLSLLALKELYGTGEVVVPTLTWVSDIAAVIQNGFKPVFVDINPRNLCMDEEQVLANLNENTRAVFLTYVQGFNGLSDRLLAELKKRNIPLIEDVCESHGATFKGQKVGSFGLVSNFSFYFAHHMSTIEGGMVCTNDSKLYEIIRMCRSHGMVREISDESLKNEYKANHPDLNPEFIFAYPAYNMRNNEIGAVMGLNQIKRLDENIKKRNNNFERFLDGLDPEKYRVDFDREGMSNYALNLVLKNGDDEFCLKVMSRLRELKVEFRRGSAGGGNQTRQPYLRGVIPEDEYKKFPRVDHIHFYGFYIGNYPELERAKIDRLCAELNAIN